MTFTIASLRTIPRSRRHLPLLLASSALAGMTILGISTFAHASDRCLGDKCFAGLNGNQPKGQPSEQASSTEAGRDAPAIAFAISVDGETVDASADPSSKGPPTKPASGKAKPTPRRTAEPARASGNALRAVDIKVKFDGLDVKPLLNVMPAQLGKRYQAGDEVRFLATSNYPAFIERAELRIHEVGDDRDAGRPLHVIPVSINSETRWRMPASETIDEYRYVLRVYDAKGRYDETQPLIVARTDKRATPDLEPKTFAPGMSEDRTAVRNIPVRGGAVTVYGRNVPDGYAVRAFGETIPLDNNRAFVSQRILLSGEHDVDVAVTNAAKGNAGLHFNRQINIPDNDWFYVAMADLTVGKRSGDKNIEVVRPGEYDKVYSKGRIAYYLKGKIKGEYLLTASADTGEDDIRNIFRNLDGKDPRRLLRRLNPSDYYPVYGDDSTFREDAPTKGKFYVRLEKGDSHVMWGNFRTRITGTEFMRQERALYGAHAAYRSEQATSFGERRTEVSGYASQPDTLPQREEFLATGGSSYAMRRQDIIAGSDTLTVETRDPVTGRVLQRQILKYGEDYSFNYLQGMVILKRPLSTMTGTSAPVRDGALGGNAVYLIAQYEYEPVAGKADGYVYGGRAQHWVNDKVRVGVTGMDENTGDAKQQASGVDVKLRHSETTFLDSEFSHSRGPGFSYSRSTDGGLTSSDFGVAGNPSKSANAWRMRGQVDLADVPGHPLTGKVGGYYEQKQAGYSSMYDQIRADRRLWGAFTDIKLGAKAGVHLSYDDFADDLGQTKRNGASNFYWSFDERWKVTVGVNYRTIMSPLATSAGKSGYDGSRIDAGARIDYKWNSDLNLYGFAQSTLGRSGDIDRNDRVGLGAKVKLTDKIGTELEASYGVHGIGGLVGVTYDPVPEDHYYLGYRLDPDRAFSLDRTDRLLGSDRGALVSGVRKRMGDTTTAYSESNYDMFGRKISLTQTYGVVYTPDKVWTVNGGFKAGRVRDDTVDTLGVQRSDFDRYAPTLSIAYKDDVISARTRGEVRIEESADKTRNQNTYLFASGLSWKTSEDWRLLAHVDAVISESQSSLTSFQNTDYVESSLGYAYRPIAHDQLNMLFKYTWLYDMPGNGQLIAGGTRDLLAPAQRSHIVSGDLIYDLTPWLSIGAKYGMRYGEVRYRTDGKNGLGFDDNWQTSSAHLGVLRGDVRFLQDWSLLGEARVMHMPEAQTTDYGALVAVYRKVGKNLRLGVGYNFGIFSDDLRDLTLNDRGVFLNVIGTL